MVCNGKQTAQAKKVSYSFYKCIMYLVNFADEKTVECICKCDGGRKTGRIMLYDLFRSVRTKEDTALFSIPTRTCLKLNPCSH